MTTEPKQTRGGKWESGLCNCGQNCNVCCVSLVAPWWFLMTNTDQIASDSAPMFHECGTCCTAGQRIGWFYGITFYAEVCYCGSSATSGIVGFLGLLHCFAICGHACVRQRIREKYSIPPGCCTDCDDCCVALWCYPCAITQEKAQLEYELPAPPSAPPKQPNFMLPPELTKGV